MRFAIKAILLGSLLILGACGSSSIFRPLDLGEDGESVVLDAKQRVVANLPGEAWTGAVPPRYIKPTRIVCPEPSPDVASSLSQALSASLSGIIPDGTQASASGSYAAAESIAQLGQRLATTQLLRDELADLCRSYANGAISTTNYTLRLAQLDEKMVTLLTAEMIAGSFQRDSASISGSVAFAVSEQTPQKSEAQIQAQRDALSRAREELAAAVEEEEVHLATPPAVQTVPNGASAEERERITEANRLASIRWDARARRLADQSNSRRRSVTDAELRYAENPSSGPNYQPVAGANVLSGSSAWLGGGGRRASENLVNLQQNYLDRDELGAIVDTCLTRMNEDVLAGYGDNTDDSRSRSIQNEIAELEDASAEVSARLEFFRDEYRSSLDAFVADRRSEQALQPTFEERAILRNEFDAGTELDSTIREFEAELAALRNKISARRSGASGLSQQTLDFNETCQRVMDSFSNQLVKAQNARLELQLKQLEANVQTYRFAAMQEQMRFCSNVLATNVGMVDAPAIEQQRIVDVCLENLKTNKTPILGELRSIRSGDPQSENEDSAWRTEQLLSLAADRAATSTRSASIPTLVDFEPISATGRITSSQLNVRTCPSPSCTVKRRLTLNTEVSLTARTPTEDWYRISPNGSPDEWIFGTYVEVISTN